MNAISKTSTRACSSAPASFNDDIPSLHHVLADRDGSGSGRAPDRPLSAGSSRRPSPSLRAGWSHLKHLNARIEDSWLGDVLGCASLFGMLVVGLLIAGALQ